MRVDTNTNGHRQWFYFSVRNLVPGVIKFNIYRFKKKFSLFQRGMRPYVFSMKSKSGWKPGCMKVMYKTQRFVSDHHKNPNESPTYYLSFQYKFEFPEDEVYFASGIPYPVSYLNKRLAQFQSAPNNQIQLEISNIGKTLCGQDVKFIQISPKIKSGLNYIIINARTHAGETSSSWVLDGLLQRLLTDDSIKKWINDNNICFKIIPMLNPDGVFVGNYRTGILGEDFNRKFATGKKELFPQIHILRKVINDCKRSGKVLLFFDLHGHSVLKNSFIYGPSQSLFSQHPFRNLPFTIWHQSKYFRLSSCKFKFNQDMAETARIYFQIKQNILTYTCEISLGLYYQGNNTIQMLEEDYKSLGQSMIVSMVQLLTKQKVNNFQTTQETVATLQKIIQASNEVNEQPKNTVKQPTLPKQIVDKGQNKSINKREKQKDRETCLQKIKNIKKQLQEEQNFAKRQYTSLEQDKIQKSMNKSSLNKRKLQLNCSIEGATDKLSVRPANKLSFAPRKISAFDPFDLNQTEQEGSPVKATRIQQKKAHREAQFKIRRKSDMNRILPESLRKKLGPKIQLGFTSTKHFKQQEEQQSYMLERSATYDTPYLSTQIQKITENTQQQNGENLEIINEKFSEEYQSINDSDGSSEDLCEKQKQYLIECIKNNKKLKTTENDDENQQQQEQEVEETGNSTAVNINGFKQIRFKSIETEAIKTMFPLRSTKRDAHKFRDLTHKSLGRNLYDQQGMMMPQMIQKKQLNERINKKNVREPYFLVQIKNKNH